MTKIVNAFDVDNMTQWWSRERHVLCLALLQFFPKALYFNKAVGTIWRDLSKPHQSTQGHDPRPLWLLVRGSELASRRAEHSLLWRMSLNIFDILLNLNFLSPYMSVY